MKLCVGYYLSYLKGQYGDRNDLDGSQEEVMRTEATVDGQYIRKMSTAVRR